MDTPAPCCEASGEDESAAARFHLALPGPSIGGPPPASEPAAQTPSPASAQTSPSRATAWQRLCANKGVQRAIAIAKLAADCLDLPAASLVSYVIGQEVVAVVMQNFARDWRHLLDGKRPGAEHLSASAVSGPDCQLIHNLDATAQRLNDACASRSEKLSRARFSARSTGLMFAASFVLMGLGVAAAVCSGGAALAVPVAVVSVYQARQAYANWRLARENLEAAQAGRAASPLGANALAHALYHQYLRDSTTGLTPSQAQARAETNALKVTGLNILASASFAGLGLAGVVSAGAAGAGMSCLNTPVVSGLRDALRLTGRVAVPAVTLTRSSFIEARTALHSEHRGFDDVFQAHWETHFCEYPHHLVLCREAYRAYAPNREDFEALDAKEQNQRVCEALARWARDTRRRGELRAWMALEAVPVPGQPNWAQRLFQDLASIDASRTVTHAGNLSIITANLAVTAAGLAI